MKRRTREVDHWRHFIPHAPDIELQVESGAVTTHVLDNDVMIQGAREPQTHVSPSVDLSKIPLQRGWRLTFVPITHPQHGQVKNTIDGFNYEIHKQFNGVDCFNYILSNGTQESNVATVTLNVVQGYEYNIAVRQDYGDMFEVEMLGLRATELPLPQHQLFRWYLTKPELVNNRELGRKQVEFKRRLVGYYEIGGYRDSEGRYQYVVSSNPVKIKRAFPDDVACNGFPIGDTDALYESDGNRGVLDVEVVFYFGELMRSESRTFYANPDSIYGRRWWESGNREGQPEPVEQESVASSVDLNSDTSIDSLMTIIEALAVGSTPNQASRNMLKDLGSIIGTSNGSELTAALHAMADAGGDVNALMQKVVDGDVVDTLRSLSGGF